ncbi:protein ANTI-SILENCING 1 [Gossypium raimondii]|uniref:protein ANTI-SILENCING 1 n=1 Tax=Gossypium raimondii TaxID=29730 RepID=UPI00227CA370|nr:protein ANTI-SILENCING 1 [Gossypium raimondii]XP_052487538.1 protein ANTI-SILENCING 1 [Gossypium raimondii]XP_052487539.1 protein ANTI-SILENCING 1 [Gossypium raimondii]
MSHIREKNREEKNLGFKWGIPIGAGAKNSDIMFYESFIFKGEEYFVYNCVYFDLGQPEASIGKLVKLFEGPDHVKKVKVVWFMRPSEIRNYLGDYEPRWNEIFLASGQGRGVSNINLVESIVGKCNVVCTSNDHRNPQAYSEADLRRADYFFCCHFDVGELAISDTFPDMVDRVKVEHFFNKKTEQKLLGRINLKSNVKGQTQRPKLSSKIKVVTKSNGVTVKDDNSGSRVSSLVKEPKVEPVSMSKQVHLPSENIPPRPKTSNSNSSTQHSGSSQWEARDEIDKAEVKFPKDSLSSPDDVQPYKKRKLFLDERTNDKVHNLDGQIGHDRGINIDNQLVQVSRVPDDDRSNWFEQQPWEQRLERAQESGRLVLLENVDPSYTSEEVEDLVWHAFNEKVEAKMIEQTTFSCPCYGKALIIFKSKEAANSAIFQLMKRCLMLADGRPLIARRESLRKGAKVGFVGHLTIDKLQLQRQTEDMKKAKSTSHASQPNNIEFDMGMEWRLLQLKSDMWWKALHERQEKEIEAVRNQLKMEWQ